jgi:hypothetical protein
MIGWSSGGDDVVTTTLWWPGTIIFCDTDEVVYADEDGVPVSVPRMRGPDGELCDFVISVTPSRAFLDRTEWQYTVELAGGFAWITQDDGRSVRVSLTSDQRAKVIREQSGVYMVKCTPGTVRFVVG